MNCEESMKNNENFLLGISDYFFIPKKGKTKDKRNSPPLWMKFKLHQKEWRAGWEYAKSQECKR